MTSLAPPLGQVSSNGLDIQTSFGIPMPEDKDYRLSKKIDTEKTLEYMAEISIKYAYQTETLAKFLESQPGDIETTARNIFRFYRKYIPYEYDRDGNEELRTPARLFWDAVRYGEGVDCDCYAITTSTILLNLAIPHVFRVVEWRAGEGFAHVYVVAFDPESGQEYPIDPIPEVPGELQELAYNRKQDYEMNETNLLAGGGASMGAMDSGPPLTASEFEGIIREVLGASLDMNKTVRRREFVEKLLVAVLEGYRSQLLVMMQSAEATEAGIYYAKVQLDMIARSLEDFPNPARRGQTLRDAMSIYEESSELWQTLYELHNLSTRLDNEFTTIARLIEEVGASGLAGTLGFKFFKKIGRFIGKAVKTVSKIALGPGGGGAQPTPTVITTQQQPQVPATVNSQTAQVATRLQRQNAQLQKQLEEKEQEKEEQEEKDKQTKKYWLWGAIAGGVLILILIIFLVRARNKAQQLTGKLKRKRRRRSLRGKSASVGRSRPRRRSTTTKRRRRISAPRRYSGKKIGRAKGRRKKGKTTKRRRR